MKILFLAAVVNNLADDGDVLVKRKKFVGGREVLEDVWQLVCSIKNKVPVPCCLTACG